MGDNDDDFGEDKGDIESQEGDAELKEETLTEKFGELTNDNNYTQNNIAGIPPKSTPRENSHNCMLARKCLTIKLRDIDPIRQKFDIFKGKKGLGDRGNGEAVGMLLDIAEEYEKLLVNRIEIKDTNAEARNSAFLKKFNREMEEKKKREAIAKAQKFLDDSDRRKEEEFLAKLSFLIRNWHEAKNDRRKREAILNMCLKLPNQDFVRKRLLEQNIIAPHQPLDLEVTEHGR